MKYLLVIGDGMADNPVPQLDNKTPLQTANIPTIDRMAARGLVGHVINCPKPLPAGSETAILSIFGCDPLRYFTGRSPMEAAAAGIRLLPGDAAFRCNLVTLEDGDQPLEKKKILSHSAGSIDGESALESVDVLLSEPRFAKALRDAEIEIHRFPAFRQLAVQHNSNIEGISFIPPHDHLGEEASPLFPSGSERAKPFAELMRLAHEILDRHPVTEKRRAAGKMPANGIWFWAEGTAVELPGFREQYGCGGAVISAVPLVHGIGVLRGLEMVEVEGATGELDTNFPGKLEAVWEKLQEYDFVCLHLEAPDECTHNGDLTGKVQAIEWLDSRLVTPLLDRLENAGLSHRVLLLSDHKTLTATRGHDGDPVPFLLYDSRRDDGRGGVYDEPAGENGPFIQNGSALLDLLFEKTSLS
ncbi:MAG: 2,3-bisphosphoglycerate-independent phosphoglycerate mutase [Oscillospiraceae bacterium]|nr:2,3-bisphosphoglycerate-independent phosphoglycerate mutase [Oscillospiraceae bacterium]